MCPLRGLVEKSVEGFGCGVCREVPLQGLLRGLLRGLVENSVERFSCEV